MNSGLLRDQFVKTPRASKWYDMHAVKKESASNAVFDWSPELNKTQTVCSLEWPEEVYLLPQPHVHLARTP